MEQKFANLISVLFHPVLIPTYMLVVLLNSGYFYTFGFSGEVKLYLIAFVFIMTCLIPASLMFVLKKTGIIKTIRMNDRQERMIPIAITSVIYYITYYALSKTGILNVYNRFLLGITVLSLFSLLINFSTKISLHMIAMGGITGALLGFMLNFPVDTAVSVYLFFLLSGLVGYARLTISNHTLRQVYNGFMLGFVVMLALFVI